MVYRRKSSVRPVVLEQPSPEFLPGMRLTELQSAPAPKLVQEKWWEELTLSEQSLLQVEGQGLAVALLVQGYSRLAIGAHLVKAQAILEPHSLFGKFLKLFRFTPRTAYRYIQRYNNASANLPEAILRAAMARGVDLSGEHESQPLGRYTEAVKSLPPPSDPTPEQADRWIDQVVEESRGRREAGGGSPRMVELPVADPEEMLKEAYRFVVTRYRRLPINGRVRAKWINDLAGLMLSELGVGNPQSIKPIAIPEDYRAQRGRPREAAAAAAA